MNRVAAGTHDDEPRQILVHRAQTVCRPRSETWKSLANKTGIHLQRRAAVGGTVGFHAAEHRHVVNACRHMGKQFRHPGAGFPVLLKFERRTLEFAFGFLCDRVVRFEIMILAVHLVQHRFGVKRIHVAGATHHEK